MFPSRGGNRRLLCNFPQLDSGLMDGFAPNNLFVSVASWKGYRHCWSIPSVWPQAQPQILTKQCANIRGIPSRLSFQWQRSCLCEDQFINSSLITTAQAAWATSYDLLRFILWLAAKPSGNILQYPSSLSHTPDQQRSWANSWLSLLGILVLIFVPRVTAFPATRLYIHKTAGLVR